MALSLHIATVEMDFCAELGDSAVDGSSVLDDRFDQIFPSQLRKLSSIFWTPVTIAAQASQLLVDRRGTRVLDVGSGVGKFCLVAAALTDGDFTGIEQREDLVKAAKDAVAKHRITNIQIIHGNVTEHSFSEYDAFYLFNPFEAFVFERSKINGALPVSVDLYLKCVNHVAAQLARKSIGTRVVTYAGCAHEVPNCYACKLSRFGGHLKLWVKVREATLDDEQFGKLKRSPRIATERSFGKLEKSPMENAGSLHRT